MLKRFYFSNFAKFEEYAERDREKDNEGVIYGGDA